MCGDGRVFCVLTDGRVHNDVARVVSSSWMCIIAGSDGVYRRSGPEDPT